ncbi:hypothetical protein PTSG_00606 [Salpingoeca rosetta]|uniref:Uncharacterized protein n=1 Tax=Salpingoeca rosetta (strain ATCC 50818 / BSB-021) TaxID=946362 RepID=F2TWY8_SALR5|nr:uncharacterized protein PTSG_00606 [Salpingoeca rosetta]EGD75897.1 hypothetical protein PTSG_00606 [Salpingoeca rosetta]|eukprot:XP_004998073.1 hypothetical protein PTSG_00606 [Salpingoeca rosetta]
MSSAVTGVSVRERQRRAVVQMLGSPTTWKVLVYDRAGQAVLAPLMGVKELREQGVTLHRLLGAERDPLPDVPAVYFCKATKENIQLICEEIRANCYERYELNFLTTIPRLLLEELAEITVEAGSSGQVTKVYDMYSDFKALEDDFFTLTEGDDDSLSYQRLNDPTVSDEAMQDAVDRIVNSIFSVFVTIGAIPIIRCSPRNAAQYVAEGLDNKFREHIRNKGHSLFAEKHMDETGSFARPVLVLLDRGLDIPTMMHHTWTYQALVHDVHGMRANRTTIRETDDEGRSKVTHLNMEREDLFWHTNRGKDFPTVTQAVHAELALCKQKEKEINGTLEATDGTSAAGLTSAINNLPDLLKQKSYLTMHVNILTSLMKSIEDRKLDDYYQLEEEVMNNKSLSRPVLELLKDEDAGTVMDRLRLFIIHMLDGKVTADEAGRCEDVLRAQGCSLDAINYIRSLQEMQRAHQQPSTVQPSHTGSLFSLANKTLQTGASFWSNSVKALAPTYGDLPITRIVDSIVTGNNPDLTQHYLYFDPKRSKSARSTPPAARSRAEQAFVFMVGGGNYIEYQNLRDYCQRHDDRNIVYGVTQLVNAEEETSIPCVRPCML